MFNTNTNADKVMDKIMINNKQSSVVETAIKQIYQCILDSKNPNTLTKRGGDYRIGLQKAINILEDLKAMQQEQAQQYAAFCIECSRQDLPLLDFNDWISLNKTSGGNK